LLGSGGKLAERLLMTEALKVECDLMITSSSRYTLSVQIKELNGTPVFHFPNGDANFLIPEQPGKYRVNILLPPLHLYPGEYLVQLTLCAGFGEHFEPLHIVDTLGFSSEQDYALCSRPLGRHAGVVFSKADWQYELLPAEKS
jgi:hypothetical protein